MPSDEDYPHDEPYDGFQCWVSLMRDPLVDVTVRVYADFADRATLAEVLAAVARNDLDTPNSAVLPELVERLARQRLAASLAYQDPATARPRPNPTDETGSSAADTIRMRQPVAHPSVSDDLTDESEPIDETAR